MAQSLLAWPQQVGCPGSSLGCDPMFWPCPRLGPSSNVTLQVGFSGVQPKAVDPTLWLSLGLRPSPLDA